MYNVVLFYGESRQAVFVPLHCGEGRFSSYQSTQVGLGYSVEYLKKHVFLGPILPMYWIRGYLNRMKIVD